MKYQQKNPVPLSSSDLIQRTLQQFRETSANGRNPLAGALEAYRLQLQSLRQPQLRQVRNELINRIMQEDNLSARFVLKLMHDTTDAVCEGRRPAYSMSAAAVSH